MQLLCYHLFNNKLLSRVEIDVWDKTLLSTLNDMGHAIFDTWFGQASSEESKILRIIAMAKNPISLKIVQEMARDNKVKISQPNIAKYLQRLVEKQLISKTGRGLYIIPDRMFRTYIKNLQNKNDKYDNNSI